MGIAPVLFIGGVKAALIDTLKVLQLAETLMQEGKGVLYVSELFTHVS